MPMAMMQTGFDVDEDDDEEDMGERR